ncbi:MAG: SprB repeat-containing protein, partial [Bacteroidota bacterium]
MNVLSTLPTTFLSLIFATGFIGLHAQETVIPFSELNGSGFSGNTSASCNGLQATNGPTGAFSGTFTDGTTTYNLSHQGTGPTDECDYAIFANDTLKTQDAVDGNWRLRIGNITQNRSHFRASVTFNSNIGGFEAGDFIRITVRESAFNGNILAGPVDIDFADIQTAQGSASGAGFTDTTWTSAPIQTANNTNNVYIEIQIHTGDAGGSTGQQEQIDISEIKITNCVDLTGLVVEIEDDVPSTPDADVCGSTMTVNLTGATELAGGEYNIRYNTTGTTAMTASNVAFDGAGDASFDLGVINGNGQTFRITRIDTVSGGNVCFTVPDPPIALLFNSADQPDVDNVGSSSSMVCPGETFQLTGTLSNGPATLEWSLVNPPTGVSANFVTGNGLSTDATLSSTSSSAETVTIQLKATNAAGCADSLSTTVTVNPTPDAPDISTVPSDTCQNYLTPLEVTSSSSSFTYNWTITSPTNVITTPTGASITFVFSEVGTYTVSVTATDVNTGCTSSSSTSVTIDATPEVDPPLVDLVPVCPGTNTQQVNLGSSPSGASFEWTIVVDPDHSGDANAPFGATAGSGQFIPSFVPTPQTPGAPNANDSVVITYTVVAVAANGCRSDLIATPVPETFDLSINPQPALLLVPADYPAICFGDSYFLPDLLSDVVDQNDPLTGDFSFHNMVPPAGEISLQNLNLTPSVTDPNLWVNKSTTNGGCIDSEQFTLFVLGPVDNNTVSVVNNSLANDICEAEPKLVLESDATNSGSGDLEYQWQVDRGNGTFVDLFDGDPINTDGGTFNLEMNGKQLEILLPPASADEYIFRVNVSISGSSVAANSLTECGPFTSSTQDIIIHPLPVVDALQVTKVSCNGGNNGAIAFTDIAGDQPITVTAVPQNTITSTPVIDVTGGDVSITNLEAEDYLVTITTVEGCSIDTLIEVPEADPLSFTLSKTDALCNGSEDGTITVNASGGCGTYEYSINNGAYQTGNEFTELIAGTYSIRIRDAMDITCITTTQQITVGEPDALEINATVNNVSCFGEADGEIGTNVMGGTMPYFYNWSGQDTIVPSTVVIAEYDFDTDISDWTPFLGSVNTFTNQMMASTGPLAAGPYWTYDPSAAPGESGDRSLGVLKTAAGQFVRWESPQFKNETIYPWENVTVNFDVEAPWFANDILLESNAVEFQWQVRLIGTNGNPGSWIPIFPTEVSIDNSGVTTGGTASPETWLSDATMDSEGKSARNLLLDLTPLGDIDPDMGVQVRFSYPTNNAPVTEDIMLGLDNFSIQANQLVDSLFGLVAGTYTLDLTDANGCNLVEEIEVIEPDSLGINVLSIPNPCEEDATFDIVYDGAVGTITGYQIFIDSSPVGNGQSSFVPWTTGSSGTLLVDQTIFEDFSNSPLTLTDGTYTIRLRLYGPNLNANPPNFCFADFGPFTLTIDDKPILDTSFDDDVCSDEELGYVAASIAGSPVDPTGLLLILEDVRVDAGLVAASTNVDTTSLPDTLSLDALSMDSYNSLASGGLFVEYDVRLITPDGCVGDLETLSFRVRSEPVLANDLDATVCSGRRTRITLAASTTSGNQGGQPNQYLFEITDIAPNGLTSNGNTLVGDVVGTNGIFNDRWTNNTGAPVDVVYTIVPFNNTANNQCQGDTAQITVTVETEPDLTIDLDYGQNSSLSDQRMNSTDGPVTVVYEICSGDDFFAAASMNAQSTFGTNFVQVTVAGANPEVLGYPNSQTFVTPVANFTFGAPDIINVDGVVKEAIINIRPYFEEVDDTQLDPSECRGGRIQITVRVNPEPAFSALTPIVRDTFCSEDMVDLVLIDPAQTAAGSTSPGITIYDQPGDFVFVVPPTVDESQDLDFTIWGADGGSFGTNQGGLGANVVFSIAGGTYNPLDTFLVGVGSAGVNGDGGDATVIVRNPFDGMIGTLEAIAAGGGGAGALLDGGNATLLGMSTDIMNGDTGVGFAGIGGQGFISLDPNVTTVLQGGMFRNTGGGGGAGLEGGDGGGSDIDAGGEGGTSWPTTPLNGNTNPNGPNGYVQIDYTLQVPDISFAVDTIINIDGLAEADLLGSPTAGDSTLLVGEQWTNLADTASTIQYTLFPQVTNTTCTGDDAAFDVILTIEPTPRIDLIGDVTTVSQFEEYTAEICGEGQLNIQLISPTVPSEGINRFRYRLEDIIIDNDGGNANITVDGSSTPSGSMTLGNGTQQIFLDDNIINTGTSAGSVTYTFFPFINRANGDPNCDGDTVTLIVNVDPTIVLPSISDPIADLCSEETLGSAFDFTDFSAFNVVPTSINLIGYSVSPNSGNFTASAGNVDTTGLGQNIPITGLNVDTLRNDVFTNLT